MICWTRGGFSFINASGFSGGQNVLDCVSSYLLYPPAGKRAAFLSEIKHNHKPALEHTSPPDTASTSQWVPAAHQGPGELWVTS